MSLWPQFLDPTTGLIAAGIAAPILLLLYFLKLRRRDIAISSTLLWRKSIEDLQVNTPFQKLRKNLLLFLQMLLLLLLCLALGRPILYYTRGAGYLSIILIARSALMGATDGPGGRSRFEESNRQAGALIDTMGRHAQ